MNAFNQTSLSSVALHNVRFFNFGKISSSSLTLNLFLRSIILIRILGLVTKNYCTILAASTLGFAMSMTLITLISYAKGTKKSTLV